MPKRGILIHPQDISPLWPERLARAGIGVLGLHPTGGPEAARSLGAMIAGRGGAEMRSFLNELDCRGIAVEYEMHALRYLLPGSMFSQRPDFFPMNEAGVRTPEGNLCASNPDALAYISEKSRELALKLPSGTHRYHFWLEDAAASGCRCPGCRALSPSDQQLRILHAMLAGIRQADPKGRLAYLAYQGTQEPPRAEKPDEGIFLEFAPIIRDFHRPLNDPECGKNAAAIHYVNDLLALFGRSDAQALDYWMDNSLFSNWKRPPALFALDETVLYEDAVFYRNAGFSVISSFGCFLGPDYEALYGVPPLDRYGRVLADALEGR